MVIQIQLASVKLGVLEADGVRVAAADEGLARMMSEICDRMRQDYTLGSLAEAEETRAVRSMFREWDMDPSKYRPSSEALGRRVVQGKGLYTVSNVVDLCNLGSIETGWPYGCYDRARVRPSLVFRHGLAGERYEGIGKKIWHLEGRPVLADSQGPFGSPISDSTRSMIRVSAHEILAVIYAPLGAPDASLDQAMARLAERLAQFAGAQAIHCSVSR